MSFMTAATVEKRAYDVIVVGSGAGGGQTAYTRTMDGASVLMRELLDDADRVYVGKGIMPLPQILQTIARVYSGPVSFEAFRYGDRDPYEVARKGFEGLSRLLGNV